MTTSSSNLAISCSKTARVIFPLCSKVLRNWTTWRMYARHFSVASCQTKPKSIREKEKKEKSHPELFPYSITHTSRTSQKPGTAWRCSKTSSTHKVDVTIWRCPKACWDFQELHNEFSSSILSKDNRGRVVAVAVADDAFVRWNAHKLPRKGAGLSEKIYEWRFLKI